MGLAVFISFLLLFMAGLQAAWESSLAFSLHQKTLCLGVHVRAVVVGMDILTDKWWMLLVFQGQGSLFLGQELEASQPAGNTIFSLAGEVKKENQELCTLPGSLAIIFFSAFIWRFFIYWKGPLEETDPAWCGKCSDVWAVGSAAFRAVNSEPGQLKLPDPGLMENSVSKGGWYPGRFLHGALPFLLDPCGVQGGNIPNEREKW